MTTDAPAAAPAVKRRRRKPALASRIMVTGVSAASMLGLVGGFGATAAEDGEDATVAPEPQPVVVVRIVRRHVAAPRRIVRQIVEASPASGSRSHTTTSGS